MYVYIYIYIYIYECGISRELSLFYFQFNGQDLQRLSAKRLFNNLQENFLINHFGCLIKVSVSGTFIRLLQKYFDHTIKF